MASLERPSAATPMLSPVRVDFRSNPGRQPGTLSPDPWHFPLFANGMAGARQAAAQRANPLGMLLAKATNLRGLGTESPTNIAVGENPRRQKCWLRKQDVAPLHCSEAISYAAD